MSAKHLVWIAACAALATAAQAQEQDFSKVEVKAKAVAGSVYLLTGAGGNIAASVGQDGIAIVDDQFAPLADKIRAALRGVTDKPLRFVINTHYHLDHTGGNESLAQDATIIAHENVRKRLASGGETGNLGAMKFVNKPSAPQALPVITFQHDVTLHLNGEDIRALHAPNGHTDGDSIIYFTRSNVVHMGDNFVTYGFPFIDLTGGGSVKGMIATLEKVTRELPADVKVIPGHGDVSTLDDVREMIILLKDTLAVVEQGVKAGKSLQQLQQEKVLDRWRDKSGDFVTSDLHIETLYNDLTGAKSGAVRKHH